MVVEDKGPLCLAVIIATLAVSSVFIFARVLTRTLIRPQFGWDDGLIVVTWALILAYNITMFISIDRGYGRHILDLTEQQTVGAVEAEVIGQFFAIASFPSGKASIAFLLHRIFPGRKLAWFLWTVVGANAVCFYVDAILILAQCQPVAFQWDHSIPGGSCWSSKVVIDWGFLTGVTGAVTDFAFALLPWYYIRSLQMGVKEKLSVGVALSMGLFAGACSILKIYYTSTLGAHADFTFDTVPLVIWSCTELALINIAACIPTLRPLYTWLSGEGRGAAMTKPYGYPSGYGEGTGHFIRVSNRSNRSIQAGQEDEHALNIYHSKSYRVSFEESPQTPSKPPSAYGNHT